jgi:hypothetical protein
MAHVPYLEFEDFTYENPYVITEKIEKSIAVYSNFDTKEDVDVYTFELKPEDFTVDKHADHDHDHDPTPNPNPKGRELFVQLLVPHCDALSKMKPELLVTRKMKMHHIIDETFDAYLPREINLQHEEIVLKYDFNADDRTIFHEEYSNRNYYYQKEKVKNLFTPGKYKVHVYDKSQMVGDYVFAFGRTDNFDDADWAQAYKLLPTITARDELHDQKCKAELEERYPREQ